MSACLSPSFLFLTLSLRSRLFFLWQTLTPSASTMSFCDTPLRSFSVGNTKPPSLSASSVESVGSNHRASTARSMRGSLHRFPPDPGGRPRLRGGAGSTTAASSSSSSSARSRPVNSLYMPLALSDRGAAARAIIHTPPFFFPPLSHVSSRRAIFSRPSRSRSFSLSVSSCFAPSLLSLSFRSRFSSCRSAFIRFRSWISIAYLEGSVAISLVIFSFSSANCFDLRLYCLSARSTSAVASSRLYVGRQKNESVSPIKSGKGHLSSSVRTGHLSSSVSPIFLPSSEGIRHLFNLFPAFPFSCRTCGMMSGW
mmetsp:Transcript_42214/g.89777  ORF Transcript_42214/g.89777 Transcript_42214/m.89777 type:complete len:310 (+) Transcript_42214:292-1221(+)